MQPDRRLDMSHVKAIVTAKETIALSSGQFFCRTPRAWEIWQESPIRRLVRIPQKKVWDVVQ